MYGAQYLHAPIPGLSFDNGKTLRYHLIGSVEEYRRKVYGNANVTVSPESLEEAHQAWDIRDAYLRAWDLYSDLIVPIDTISADWVKLQINSRDFACIISTIPAPILCWNPEHKFNSKNVWGIGDAPERGIFAPVRVNPMTVELSGERDTGWYRASNVFGYHTVEWPEGKRPPLSDIAAISKPISTDCDCFPEVLRLGRYGTWTKGVLAHHAYEEANKL